jgi:hypothetical protein
MASSSDRSASRASSSAIKSVSLLGRRPAAAGSPSGAASNSARAAVLVRLPLWARAIPPPAALVLKAGWAFSQREPPVVE